MSTEHMMTEDSPAIPQSSIEAAMNDINIMDPMLSVTYGTKAMEQISRFSDNLLGQVRARDAGPIGENLTQLVVQLKSFDVNSITGNEPGFLEKLPVIGSLFNKSKAALASFQTLSEQVEQVAGKLEDSMHELLKDVQMLNQMYELNKNYHNDLSLIIAAGQGKLEEAKTVTLPAMQAKLKEDGNGMDAQAVKDFADQINRFEKRLHDLQISRTITLQSAPQIRLVQSNNQTLAEKIQTSLLTAIPIWKNQMVIGLTLQRQKNTAELQRKVTDTTNDLLKKNAEMLGDASVATAREVERSVVDIETLKEVHNKLLISIEETLKIADEGRKNRAIAEKELIQMEENLKSRLVQLSSDKAQASLEHAAGTQAQQQPEQH